MAGPDLRQINMLSLVKVLLGIKIIFIHGDRAPLGPVPESFDCAVRMLAVEFGQSLIPRLGSFHVLRDALSTDTCDLTVPRGAPSSKSKEDTSIFVVGAENKRFDSVQAACDFAVDTKAKTVQLKGHHYLSKPLILRAMHSGLTIQGGILSGGVEVNNLKWKKVSSKHNLTIWSAYLDLSAYNLTEVPGLQIDGKRKTRARYPNIPGGIERSCGWGCVIPAEEAAWAPPLLIGGDTVYNDTHHIRNDTTDGWFQQYTIGYGGACALYDPPASYWCSPNAAGGGATQFQLPSGLSYTFPNAPYAHPESLEFHVYRPGRWSNWMFQAKAEDSEQHNFTFVKGGFQGARGNALGGDFFIENALEELDDDGEFFFDENSSTLYLGTTDDETPSHNYESLVIPHLRTLVNVSGTQWNPVRNITLNDIVLTSTRTTYFDTHAVPSAGDWALARVGAVFVQGAEYFTISNCTFDRIDTGSAVMFSGYNRYGTVKDSDFSYLGGNAVAAWGYTNETEYDPGRPGVKLTGAPAAGIDGSDGEHPIYTTVTGSTAREIGLYEKQSSFYVQAKARRSRVFGNVFFNGPRAGINQNDGFGGGDEFIRNLVFGTCRETQDHGPMNSWDRQPFMIDGNLTMEYRTVKQNFLIDDYSPQEGVDQDDGSQRFNVVNNALVYGVRGMKNDYGGHDNHHFGNVYAYVEEALRLVNTLPGHQDYFYENTVIFNATSTPDIGNPVCDGEAPTILFNNTYYTPTGNLTECGNSLIDWQKAGGDQGSTLHTLPSDDELIQKIRTVLNMSYSAIF